MIDVLYSSELEKFLQRFDVPFEHRPQRLYLARHIAEIFLAENPYRERLLTFRKTVPWSRFRWLYGDRHFRNGIDWNLHERSPCPVTYDFILQQRPSEDKQAKGCLRVKPKRNLSQQQEQTKDIVHNEEEYLP